MNECKYCNSKIVKCSHSLSKEQEENIQKRIAEARSRLIRLKKDKIYKLQFNINIFLIHIGRFIKNIGENIIPNYWKCNNCGHIEFMEKEVLCGKCNGIGEMIYRGDEYYEI